MTAFVQVALILATLCLVGFACVMAVGDHLEDRARRDADAAEARRLARLGQLETEPWR